MFQLRKKHSRIVLVFDDLDVLLPASADVTSSFQIRLETFFLDALRFQTPSTMIIGIVNQTQLSHLSEVVCCAGYIHNIVVVPKLDKKRRKAIIHNRLHNHIDSILLERITDETASYTAADLNYLCNACMEDASASHVAALLDSHQSSFARQFHSVRSLPGGFSALFGVTDLVARVRTGILRPLLRPELFAAYGLQAPAGAVFFGPSGCGKTAMIEAVAEETKKEVQMMEVVCSDLLGKVGDAPCGEP